MTEAQAAELIELAHVLVIFARWGLLAALFALGWCAWGAIAGYEFRKLLRGGL